MAQEGFQKSRSLVSSLVVCLDQDLARRVVWPPWLGVKVQHGLSPTTTKHSEQPTWEMMEEAFLTAATS